MNIREKLVTNKEKQYFIISLIISTLSYVGLVIVGMPEIILIAIITPLISTFLSLGNVRLNGVKVNAYQFPKVYNKVVELCERMEMPKIPDIYVIESGGLLNAFASRFFGRNMVVLYSQVFELCLHDEEEEHLSFIIAHELAHVKRNHFIKNLLIIPAMWIPFFGNAYQRACEYTCDRFAVYYIQNIKFSVNSLTILAVGKKLYKFVNHEEYLNQSHKEKGLFVWVSEKFATHPPLPKRIKNIITFCEDEAFVDVYNIDYSPGFSK